MVGDDLVATVTPDPENFGDGTVTLMTPAVSDAAVEGQYRLNCFLAQPSGSRFLILDPQRRKVGDAFVGVPFAGPVRFTIVEGKTRFVTGDNLFIAVARRPAVSGEHV